MNNNNNSIPLRWLALAMGCLLLFPTAYPQEKADCIFTHGRIVTIDSQRHMV